MDLTNKHHIAELGKRIERALAQTGEDLKVKIRVGTCKFENGGDGLTFKLDVERHDVLPKFERELRARFCAMAAAGRACGMTEANVGSAFWIDGLEYRLVGMKNRVKIQPIVARQTDDGRLYRFEMFVVADAFGVGQSIVSDGREIVEARIRRGRS